MESQANCKRSTNPAELPRAGVMVTVNRSVNREGPRGVPAGKRGKLSPVQPLRRRPRRKSASSAPIAHVTIENAAKLNTLDSALMIAFVDAVEALAQRDDLRAVVLTGAGDKAFIGGANIFEMAALDATARSFHHAGAPHLRLPARAARAGDRARQRLCARRRAGSRGGLRPAHRVLECRVRHAGGEGRHSVGGRGRAAARPDRLGAHARTAAVRREHRCRDRASPGGWSNRWSRRPSSMPPSRRGSPRCCHAGPQAVRLQKKLIRKWEDLTLSQAVRAGIESFTQAYETDEPTRMMAAFARRKLAPTRQYFRRR